MKVLLDENLDHALRELLDRHEVFTVAYTRWMGLKNGELLQTAEENGFDVLLTGDRTLAYEQNLNRATYRNRRSLCYPAAHYQTAFSNNHCCARRCRTRQFSSG